MAGTQFKERAIVDFWSAMPGRETFVAAVIQKQTRRPMKVP
jgi:hypothetical protein